MNTSINKIVSAMRSSRGRFLGLKTTQGNSVNGRFVSETPCYVRVFDRNLGKNLTIAKSSLVSCRKDGEVIA